MVSSKKLQGKGSYDALMQDKVKICLLYVASYFLLALVSAGINHIFVLQSGVSPNIVVQILCVGYIVKKLGQYGVFSLKAKITLPVLFGLVPVVFYVLMITAFPEWKDNQRFWSGTTLLAVFAFNYLVGLIVMLYVLSRRSD